MTRLRNSPIPLAKPSMHAQPILHLAERFRLSISSLTYRIPPFNTSTILLSTVHSTITSTPQSPPLQSHINFPPPSPPLQQSQTSRPLTKLQENKIPPNRYKKTANRQQTPPLSPHIPVTATRLKPKHVSAP
ncbi:hypothetical protein M758_9G087600, partial [Ceratodon purpureus]